MCGCQTELKAVAAAAAAAPQARVAPASPTLPAATAAHSGRPGGAEVSRGRGARGPGAGHREQTPPERRLRSGQPPRACTPAAPAGARAQVGLLSLQQAPPHGLSRGPFPVCISLSAARTPVSLLELLLLCPRCLRFPLPPSQARSPFPTLTAYPSARNNPAPPPQSTFLPSADRAPLSSGAEPTLPPAGCRAQLPFPPGIREVSPLPRIPAGPPQRRAGAGPLSPPHPRPPQHSGDGGCKARLQLPFVPRGMAETPPGRSADPGG